jgi:CPA2 family monovalent cation:H+ antiporter-2
VVPEAIEGSLMLASHALALVGVPMRRVIRLVQDQRDAALRPAARLLPRRRRRHRRSATRSACTPSPCPRRRQAGRLLVTWPCRPWGWCSACAATAAVARSRRHALLAGDTLVLSAARALALAEEKLLRG